jgi:hypothetical protein
MQLLSLVPDLLTAVVSLVDETPEPEDVKAGWLAFGIFIALILAVALLGFSLFKHLRKAQAAEEAGVYGGHEGSDAPSVNTPGETPSDTTPGDGRS